MKPTPKTPLAAFAKGRGQQQPIGCKTCALEQTMLDEINTGFRDGIASTAVRDWLKKEHNIVIGESSLRRHRKGCLA